MGPQTLGDFLRTASVAASCRDAVVSTLLEIASTAQQVWRRVQDGTPADAAALTALNSDGDRQIGLDLLADRHLPRCRAPVAGRRLCIRGAARADRSRRVGAAGARRRSARRLVERGAQSVVRHDLLDPAGACFQRAGTDRKLPAAGRPAARRRVCHLRPAPRAGAQPRRGDAAFSIQRIRPATTCSSRARSRSRSRRRSSPSTPRTTGTGTKACGSISTIA